MRGMTHRWRLRDGSPVPSDAAGMGSSVGRVEPLTAKVLASRGLLNDSASRFLDPRLTDLHDPSLLPNADRAAERILHALRSGEKVVIYGDYDVDGVTASSILYHLAKAIAPGPPVEIYIPHRIDEGYGLNADAIRSLADDGASLIVSVDCGVTAIEPARVARERNVDLIVTDHHNMLATESPGREPQLPDCFAIVHPRIPGSRYPFHELAGAGVAFKLAWRIATMHAGSERVPAALRETLLDLLALASLGTIADIVPLVDENRVIAKFGLARLRAVRNEGLRALIDASGLGGERVSAEDVGFKLGPRLNACGRLGHAREAAELLTIATGDRAHAIAEQLTSLNRERQSAERRIFEKAMEMAEIGGMFSDDRRAVVLAHEDWHPGVVGIVCSRLVERRRRPTILLHQNNGECHGSGRSVQGVSLHAALSECADLLDSFGGHDMAAGLRIRSSNLERFTERFTEIVNAMHDIDALTPLLELDCETDLTELTPTAVAQVASMGPFGRDNPRPTLLTRELTVMQDARVMGKRSQHLSFAARQGPRTMRFVAWNWGEHAPEFKPGRVFHAAFRAELSDWHAQRGQKVVEATLEDLAFVR